MAKIKNITGSDETHFNVLFPNNVLTNLLFLDLPNNLDLAGMLITKLENNEFELYDEFDFIIDYEEVHTWSRVDNNGDAISDGSYTVRADILELNNIIHNNYFPTI